MEQASKHRVLPSPASNLGLEPTPSSIRSCLALSKPSFHSGTRITPGYCWPTPKCRNSCDPHAFLEGKKAGETSPRTSTPRTLKWDDQQYPPVICTREQRGIFPSMACTETQSIKCAASQHEKRKKESERSSPGSLTYPVHTRLILASNGPKIPKGRGECSMSGKGIEG